MIVLQTGQVETAGAKCRIKFLWGGVDVQLWKRLAWGQRIEKKKKIFFMFLPRNAIDAKTATYKTMTVGRFVVESARCLACCRWTWCRDYCAIVDRHLLPGLVEPADRARAFHVKAEFYKLGSLQR